jgi:hypothetical protein
MSIVKGDRVVIRVNDPSYSYKTEFDGTEATVIEPNIMGGMGTSPLQLPEGHMWWKKYPEYGGKVSIPTNFLFKIVTGDVPVLYKGIVLDMETNAVEAGSARFSCDICGKQIKVNEVVLRPSVGGVEAHPRIHKNCFEQFINPEHPASDETLLSLYLKGTEGGTSKL